MAILIEIKKENISLPIGKLDFVRTKYNGLNAANNSADLSISSHQQECYVLKELINQQGERMQFLVQENDLGIFNGLLDLSNIEIDKYGKKKNLFGKMETIEAVIGLLRGRGFLAGPYSGFFDKHGRNIKRLLYKNDIAKLKAWLEEVEKEFYKL